MNHPCYAIRAVGLVVLSGLLLGVSLLIQGCQGENAPPPSILMRIGERVVTVDDYRRDFNFHRTATGASPDADVAVDRDMQIHFVQQMADQLVLLEHAQTLGIVVSDRELNQALEVIQRDYPDDVFEQLLLENAITLEEWKSSLRTRLIIERVIQQELEDKIRISEQDMAQFMAQLHQVPQESVPGLEADAVPPPSDTAIVNQLRRSKTETAYAEWMAALKTRYPVEINQAVLNEVLSETADAAPSK